MFTSLPKYSLNLYPFTFKTFLFFKSSMHIAPCKYTVTTKKRPNHIGFNFYRNNFHLELKNTTFLVGSHYFLRTIISFHFLIFSFKSLIIFNLLTLCNLILLNINVFCSPTFFISKILFLIAQYTLCFESYGKLHDFLILI